MLENRQGRYISIVILIVMVASLSILVQALDPEGATVTFVSNSTKSSVAEAQNRTNDKGTISILRLSALSQTAKWKAYVGNVSSSFTLDDSDGYTIYQWAANEGYSYSGQVYATRDTSTVSWADIECAAATNKTVEDIALDLNSDNSDSVNRTFSVQVHSNFTVAGNLITENCSFATATWINDTVNTLSVTSVKYQEVLLWEGSHLVYATFVENDYSAYRNDSTYDFQMIVPVNGTVSSPDIAYYFYLEMS